MGGQAVDGRNGKNVLDVGQELMPIDMSPATTPAIEVAAWRAWLAHLPQARPVIASNSANIAEPVSNPAGNSGTAVSSVATLSLVQCCACRRRLANPASSRWRKCSTRSDGFLRFSYAQHTYFTCLKRGSHHIVL